MVATRLRTVPVTLVLAASCVFCIVLAGDEPLAPVSSTAPDATQAADPAAPSGEGMTLEEPAGPLVLEDALALALMHNPEMAVFSWEMRASEARALQAKKIPNPELDLRLYRLGIPRANTQLDEARRRLVLRQEIELGGKRARRVDVAEAERELAEWDYEAKRREILATVRGEFAAVQGAQRRVASGREAVKYLTRADEKIATMVQTGALRTFELHQSRRRLGLARVDLEAAEADWQTARFRLASMWGGRSPRFTEATGSFEEPAPLPPLEVLLAAASSSPAVARWEAEIERSEAELALAKAGRIPDVTLGGGVRWENDFHERDYLVDLEFGIPIFDRKQGDLREGRHNVAKALAAREAARIAVARWITETYLRAEERRKSAGMLADEVVPAARAMFEAARLGFETGAADPDDIFDARRDLTRAERDLADALVECHQTRATLESILGDVIGAGD